MEDYRISDEKIEELEPKIEEWKKKYPQGVHLLTLDKYPFDGIFKCPTQADMKQSAEHEDAFDSNMQLIRLCVLYPEISVFNSILEEKSGISVPLAVKLIEIAGVQNRVTEKKL